MEESGFHSLKHRYMSGIASMIIVAKGRSTISHSEEFSIAMDRYFARDTPFCIASSLDNVCTITQSGENNINGQRSTKKARKWCQSMMPIYDMPSL